jgi:O-antigen ligase
VAMDTPSLFGASTVIYSNEAMLLVFASGAFIHASIFGIRTRQSYPGIFLIFLCFLFYALPLLYMPEKIVILKGLTKNFEIIFVYFSIIVFFRSSSETRTGLIFISASVFLLFVSALYSFYFDRTSLNFLIGPGSRPIYRIDAGMGLTAFPAYLNIVLPASFAAMLMYGKNTFMRYALLLACALAIASVIAFPLSRAGWIVLIITVGFILFYLNRLKTGKTAVIAVLSGVIISIFLLFAVSGKYAFENMLFRASSSMDMNESSYLSAINRIIYFKTGTKMLKAYPMGIGPGSYKYIGWKFIDDRNLDPAYMHHLHNLPLQTAVESGVFGLLSMITLFIYILLSCSESFKNGTLHERILAVAGAASVLALFFSGLFDMPLVYSRGIFAVFIPALFAAGKRTGTDEEKII